MAFVEDPVARNYLYIKTDTTGTGTGFGGLSESVKGVLTTMGKHYDFALAFEWATIRPALGSIGVYLFRVYSGKDITSPSIGFKVSGKGWCPGTFGNTHWATESVFALLTERCGKLKLDAL